MSAFDAATPALPASLRIHFEKGERPYIFWVSHWVPHDGDRCRFKVLSKSLPDRALEILVLREGAATRRKTLAHLELPAGFPSGWLERWVETLAGELETRFEAFDLKSIQTHAEWQEVAVRLGWSHRTAGSP